MSRLRAGATARNVACIVWLEDLERLHGEGKGYAALVGHLAGLHVECACSPVHDRDMYTADDVRKWNRRHIDPDTGEVADGAVVAALGRAPRVGDPKKAHVHVLFKLRGPRSGAFFSELMEPVVSVPATKWEVVDSFDSYLRYLAHLDNQEKAPYPALEVKGFGGLDLSPLLRTSDAGKAEVLLSIAKVIEDEHIYHFWQLHRWAVSTGDIDVINTVSGRSSYFGLLLRSRCELRNEEREKAERQRNDGKRSSDVSNSSDDERKAAEDELQALVCKLFE